MKYQEDIIRNEPLENFILLDKMKAGETEEMLFNILLFCVDSRAET